MAIAWYVLAGRGTGFSWVRLIFFKAPAAHRVLQAPVLVTVTLPFGPL